MAQDNQNGNSVLQTSQFVEETRTAQESPSQHPWFTRYWQIFLPIHKPLLYFPTVRNGTISTFNFKTAVTQQLLAVFLQNRPSPRFLPLDKILAPQKSHGFIVIFAPAIQTWIPSIWPPGSFQNSHHNANAGSNRTKPPIAEQSKISPFIWYSFSNDNNPGFQDG